MVEVCTELSFGDGHTMQNWGSSLPMKWGRSGLHNIRTGQYVTRLARANTISRQE